MTSILHRIHLSIKTNVSPEQTPEVLESYIQDYFLNRVWYPLLMKEISPIWEKSKTHTKPPKHTSLGHRQNESRKLVERKHMFTMNKNLKVRKDASTEKNNKNHNSHQEASRKPTGRKSSQNSGSLKSHVQKEILL